MGAEVETEAAEQASGEAGADTVRVACPKWDEKRVVYRVLPVALRVGPLCVHGYLSEAGEVSRDSYAVSHAASGVRIPAPPLDLEHACRLAQELALYEAWEMIPADYPELVIKNGPMGKGIHEYIGRDMTRAVGAIIRHHVQAWETDCAAKAKRKGKKKAKKGKG